LDLGSGYYRIFYRYPRCGSDTGTGIQQIADTRSDPDLAPEMHGYQRIIPDSIRHTTLDITSLSQDPFEVRKRPEAATRFIFLRRALVDVLSTVRPVIGRLILPAFHS
jgi:hypothetical protein